MEAQGLPRMAGRILGALLVADPPEMSANDLMGTLQASRGSISTMTRLLEGPGLIERVSFPGDRKAYWRNRPDAWYQAMRTRTPAMTAMRRLAERGLALVEDAPAEVRRGLEDMHGFYRFMEREMPELLDRWYHEAQTERERDP